MGKKHDVHTVPDKDGLGWANKQGGKTLSRHHTQENAVKSGRSEAIKDGVEHFIHGRRGSIRERNSYGGDPYPPEG
jgi:hypothetical protein